MKTTYATMVGNICLDKAVDFEGKPAPVTFSVRKVINGHNAWSQQGGFRALHMGLETLADAVNELHSQFLGHMRDDYELYENGDTVEEINEAGEFEERTWSGKEGWYSVNERPIDGNKREYADYPLENYPLSAQKWAEKQIHSFSYDNYSVMIVTSNGDQVY